MENPIITEKKYINKKTEIKEEKEKDDLEEINIEKQILRTGSFTQKTLSNRKRSFRTRYSIFKDNPNFIQTSSSYNYKDFSNVFNENVEDLKSVIKENMDFLPVSIKMPKQEISDGKSISAPYQKAINFMNTIMKYKGPLEKLTIIGLTSIMITESVDEFWKNEKNLPDKFLNIDADELMSIYLYIVYNMDLSSIFTQLDFIDNFTTPITKQSMIGYYYTTISTCINFILEVKTKEDLGIN